MRQFHKKKGINAYIVGDWLTNIDSTSNSSLYDSDDESKKVATPAMGFLLSTTIVVIIFNTPMPLGQG